MMAVISPVALPRLLIALTVAVAVVATGCQISAGSECRHDDDCASGEQCVGGGGVLVRDGVCINGSQDVEGDVAIEDVDVDVSTCAPPLEECGDECVDLRFDPDRCGQCDNRCAVPDGGIPICYEGICDFECLDGLGACDGLCVDLGSDEENCGVCGVGCESDETCQDSQCIFDIRCDPEETPFGGGQGTAEDPFTICSAQHLRNIDSDEEYLDLQFSLAEDLDLAGEEMEIIAEFELPFDEEVQGFQGVFLGNGYEIRNLQILQPGSDVVGLFGLVYEGTVQDLVLVDAEVAGRQFVGGLVGINYGTVEGISAEVDVEGEESVGGLVGYNHEAAHVGAVEVAGEVAGLQAVGGVVGRNDGVVEEAWSSATVSGESRVGGLVGDNYRESEAAQCRIEDSEATGAVLGTGEEEAGWEPEEPEAAGPDSEGLVGGLVGRNYIDCGIINSSSSGDVNAPESNAVGGLVGWSRPQSQIVGSHATGDVRGGDFTGGLVGRVSSQLGEDWSEDDPPVDSSFATGHVEGVNSVGGLVGRSEGRIVNSHAQSTVEGQIMVGGLVGHLRRTAFGTAGQVERCFADGDISGSGAIGGLVGLQQGEVVESFASGQVVGGGSLAGGLVGLLFDDGVVYDSYATGGVLGANYVGGLVGEIRSGSPFGGGIVGGDELVARSYSTGTVDSIQAGSVGGLVGHNEGQVEDSYWNEDTSEISVSDGGTGLNSDQFADQESFSGFDFNDVWEITSQRPLLQWEP